MAVRRVQLRRGTTAQNDAFRGVEGEITIDTETKSIRVHDGDTDGGFDLMRADMSNDSFAAGNITIAEGVGANTLTIGAGATTVSIPGNLTVQGNVTQNDTLTVASKLITINANGNDTVLSNNSIGVIYERTKDGDPGAVQDSAFIIWRENGDYFVLGTASVDENTATDFTEEGDFAYTDLYLANLYAQNSVDVNNNNITNVGQIELDTITFADAGTVLTVTLEDALDNKALTIKDGGDTEYLTVNTNAESTTLGVPAKTTTIRSNTIDLGTDAANNVGLSVVARTGANAGQSLTISAGSAPTGGDADLNGGDLILATGEGDGTGTASMQFQTKVSGTDTVAERMRIHTDGNVGIGDNAPGTLLQLSGENAYLTLKNTTAENGDGQAETKIIFEDHSNTALAQIQGSHDGGADDTKGDLILSTHTGGALTEALRLDSAQLATFASNVKINGTGANALDFTDANITIGNTLAADKTLTLGGGTVKTTGDLTVEGKDVVLGTDGGGATTLKAATTAGAGNDLTISSGVGSNAGTNDGDLVLASGAQTGLTITPDQKATFAGAVEIATTLDMTDGNINNVATLFLDDIQCADDVNVFTLTGKDNTQNAVRIVDGGGTEYLNVDARDAGPNLILAQATNLSSSLTVSGLSSLDGGVDVNGSKLTVANTGATVIKSTLGVYGNLTLDDVDNNNAPNLIIKDTDGNDKFTVAGASGDTTVGGTLGVTGISTLSNTLKIVQGVVDGIIFNSDRGNENDQNAALIKVLDDSDDGNHGVLTWDDGEGSFSFSGSKLNSVLDITVGALGSTTTTISASNGAISTAGSDAYLTLKNTTVENGAGQAETQVQFQDHEGKNLATIRGSHDGGADDSKGQLLFYTNTGAQANEGTLALTISNAQLATFAGNVTVSGNTLTFGNAATIVNTDANTLTITEANTVLTGDLNVQGGDIQVGTATIVATDANTLTITEDTTVLTGDLTVSGNDINFTDDTAANIGSSIGATNLTLGGATSTVVSAGDLTVNGGANTALLTLGQDQAQDSEIKVATRTGAVGRSLTIEAGSTNKADADLNGGNLILKSGGGDGTGTSDIQFFTKTTAVDDTSVKMTLKGSGRLGLGETSPDSILHITDTAPSIKVLNTTQGDGDGARSSNVAFFGEASGGEEGQLAQITASHDGDQDDFKGQLVFGVNNNTNATTIVDVLTLSNDKSATFEGAVTIKGNLDIQNTGTLTTIDTTNLSVTDKVIELASNADQAVTDATLDTGIVFTRGSNVHPAVFFWDENDDKFVLATKEGASTSTTDFSADNAPVEAQLDVGTLNADIISIDAGSATSLAVKQGNTSYLTFDTTNTKVIANQILTAPNSSVVGSLTFGNGTIDSSTGSINFGDDTLTTTGTANFGATTVGSLDASSGGITNAGAISGISSLAGSDLDITLTDNQATSVQFAEAGLGAYLTFVTTDNSEEVVFNQGGADIDFRVEGDTEQHLLYVRAQNGSEGVGVKNNNPQFDLDITGTLGVSGLADLNGGIDVNGSNFAVSAAGAMVAKSTSQIQGTFNVTTNSATAFVVEKADGTDVLNIDTSDAAVANAVSTLQGTLKVDHLQSATGGNANFTIEIADNVADALTIQDSTNGLNFIQIDSRDDAELITLAQATSLSETLSVSGIATFISDVKLEDSSGGIIFNSDDTGDGDENNATMLTVERGVLTNAIISWDETNDEFNFNSVSGVHLVGKNASNALTVGGANSGAGAITFNVSTAGAVTAVGGFTDTTTASSFATGTTVGTLTLTNGKIAAPTLDLHSNGNIVLRVDADQANTAGDHKFSFVNGDNAEIASLDEVGALEISSNLTINGTGASALDFTDADITIGNTVATAGRVISIGGSATMVTKTVGHLRVGSGTIQAPDGNSTSITIDNDDNVGITGNLTVSGGTSTLQAGTGADAQLYIIADNAEDPIDTWRMQAPNATRTLSLGNQNVAGNAYVDVLTLTGHDTGTSTNATFAGEVTISGTGTNALDFSANNITIGNTIGANILTLGASASTVAIPGDLTVATTKSITLNSGANGADASIVVNRNDGNNAILRWVEANDRFEIDNATGNLYSLLTENDTLFTFDADGDANSITIEQTDGTTVLFKGDNGASNAGLQFTIDGNNMVLSFENTVKMPGDLTLVEGGAEGSFTCHNLTVNNDAILNGAKVKLKDPMLFMGLGNTSNSNDLGFYGRYADADNGDATRFAGFIYDVSANVWKLFDQETTDNLNVQGIDNTISPTDGMLADIDVSNVNVKGGGLTLTKTAVAGIDEFTTTTVATSNEKSFQVTVTTNVALADDAGSVDFTVTNTSALSTSVILATCTSHAVEVYTHTVSNATNFKFAFINRSGVELAADTALVINFVIL